MTKRSAVTTVALSIFGLILAACALPTESPDVSSGPTPTTSALEPTPEPSGESLEGQFEFETMDEYVDAVLPMIEEWMDVTWPQMPQPEVVYVPAGESGLEGCLDSGGEQASFTSRSYEYCPTDETVYVGQRTLWEFYSKTGDAGPAVGLAHEYGHHVQHYLNLPEPQTAAQSIRYENQADCIAGAWVKFTKEKRWLEIPDDIEDIALLFPLIGSAEGIDRDHGTTEEREEAFNDGFTGGVTACAVRTG